jgi:hypothetical protein
MPFTLENVVPWGRNLTEYRAMFTLTDADLQKRILGCGDGPASFNAEATQQGVQVISCDPLYQFAVPEIEARIQATYDLVVQGMKDNLHQFTWSQFPTPEAVGEARMTAMRHFLADYQAQDAAQRYVTAELPELPFADASFDLALCSHFLFLYSEQFSLEFHLQSVRELCRVAREIRIFPLLALDALPSPHVEPVSAALHEAGYMVEQVRVPYEFQRGGDRMLYIRRQ